jgi:hypothetical protein
MRPCNSASTITTSGVRQDVEQLDRLLRVQQAPDVLRDLRHVLDDQEARLVAAGTT